MISRRSLLGGAAGAACLAGLSGSGMAAAGVAQGPFVRVQDGQFFLGNTPYRYVGTNMWYGAYLGATEAGRARLTGELDTLSRLGIRNVRMLAASEHSPLNHSLRPAIHGKGMKTREDILRGLDFCLAEMAKRDMKAVLFLNNFWEWSGGFVTYLYWVNGGHYINLGDPKHPWPEFADFSAQFYKNGAAQALYLKYVASVLTRTNTVTKKAYRDDPAIMAWQLANEPRPGGSPDKAPVEAFYHWAGSSAAVIKKYDPNHLVSSGNEGVMGCLGQKTCVEKLNALPGIDYLTFHVWPLNWGWLKADDMKGTFAGCAEKSRAYIQTHLDIAKALGKPAVAEEFGCPRDGNSFAPTATTVFRDQYYSLFFDAVENSAKSGGAFAGTNFWAWGGAGRALHKDFLMHAGDTNYTGDPPQEPQGQNSVFDCDVTTLKVISQHAKALI